MIFSYVAPVFALTHPTLILLHGAIFTSSVWLPVQTDLQNKGYHVVTLDTPGRLHDGVSPQQATLPAAVDKLCQVINLQSEPVVLVGHSQAGAIITQATTQCGQNIRGLVYLAAVVPFPGERPFDLLGDQENKNFDLSAPLDMDLGLSIPDETAPIHALFMADASQEEAKHAIGNMVPEPIIFAYDVLNYDLTQLDLIPKYYIKTANDLIISPESQNKFIERLAMTQVWTLQSSHCPFISQPIQLSQLLQVITARLYEKPPPAPRGCGRGGFA